VLFRSREYATQIRKEHGRGIVAERCVPYLNELLKKNRAILLDSLRSPEEDAILRKKYRDFVLVAIKSSTKARFSRLGKKRPGHKSDEPKTIEELEWRDRKELSWGLGDVIARADLTLENEGSEEDFRKRAGELIEGILKRRA
jgi:dephospho-CoA kinase